MKSIIQPSRKEFNTAIRKAVLDTLKWDVDSGKQSIRLKQKFSTACWSFQPPHLIFIGEELFDKDCLKDEVSKSSELQSLYIESHYHHENAHSLYTEKNLKKINELLKEVGLKSPLKKPLPFSLLNLFEDAFIEEKYRNETTYRFNWLKVEQLIFKSGRPEEVLFALIQSENNFELVKSNFEMQRIRNSAENPLSKEAFDLTASKLNRIYTYYYLGGFKIGKTPDRVRLVKEWVEEFGMPPQNEKGGPGDSSDLEDGMKLQEDAELLAEFMQTSSDATKDSKEQVPNYSPKEANTVDAPVDQSGSSVLGLSDQEIDMEEVSKLVWRIEKAFKSVQLKASTETPQKKISVSNILKGKAPYRKKITKAKGPSTVYFQIDCSGSMSGEHIKAAREIATALSILAKRGKVSGHVCISAVLPYSGESYKQVSSWETFKLPLSLATLSKIHSPGNAEGLEPALKGNLGKIKEADLVMVFTDGQICDKPIVKSDFNKYGIQTWGIYVGKPLPHILKQLDLYFDKALVRDSALSTIDAMLTQI